MNRGRGDLSRDDDHGSPRVVNVVREEEEEEEETNDRPRKIIARRRTRRRVQKEEEEEEVVVVVVRVAARDGQEGFQAQDPMENAEHRW